MSATAASDTATASIAPLGERTVRFKAMGGWVTISVAGPPGSERMAERDLRVAAGRIHAWASRLTRFDDESELSLLNRDQNVDTLVGPTMGTLLSRSCEMSRLTGGLVDITLLDARLAAESGADVTTQASAWRVARSGRRHRLQREGAVDFDLDGVGKGWIADRALKLLGRYPSAMVDADGDVAWRRREMDGTPPDWAVAIADPRTSTADLAVISPPPDAGVVLGIATSGTTVHRWQRDAGWAHHLIDPRTGRPAETDVVQATVVAKDALTAEALAKAVVISGSDAGLRLLQRTRADAAFLLLGSGEFIAPVGADRWLA